MGMVDILMELKKSRGGLDFGECENALFEKWFFPNQTLQGLNLRVDRQAPIIFANQDTYMFRDEEKTKILGSGNIYLRNLETLKTVITMGSAILVNCSAVESVEAGGNLCAYDCPNLTKIISGGDVFMEGFVDSNDRIKKRFGGNLFHLYRNGSFLNACGTKSEGNFQVEGFKTLIVDQDFEADLIIFTQGKAKSNTVLVKGTLDFKIPVVNGTVKYETG